MKINDTISLCETEQAICRGIARARFSNNRKSGIINKKVGKQSNDETDLEGFAAEFAFCKLFNVFPDFTVSPRNSNEDAGDAVLPGGLSVDIKVTKYPTGRLLAVPWKANNVELYALMIGEFPVYTFKGFMRREDLLKEERLGNLGYGQTYIAQQHELCELSELMENQE